MDTYRQAEVEKAKDAAPTESLKVAQIRVNRVRDGLVEGTTTASWSRHHHSQFNTYQVPYQISGPYRDDPAPSQGVITTPPTMRQAVQASTVTIGGRTA